MAVLVASVAGASASAQEGGSRTLLSLGVGEVDLGHVHPGGRPLIRNFWIDQDGPAAEDVVATVTAPAGWVLSAPGEPQRCLSQGDGSLRCELGTVDLFGGEVQVAITPPPEGSGTGVVGVGLTSSTPLDDRSTLANGWRIDYAPAGDELEVEVTPRHEAQLLWSAGGDVRVRLRNATEEVIGGFAMTVEVTDNLTLGWLDGTDDFHVPVRCSEPEDPPAGPLQWSRATCRTGSLAIGAQAQLWVSFSALRPGPGTIRLTAHLPGGDRVVEHDVDVVAPPDLPDIRFDVTPYGRDAVVGEPYSFALTVTNVGTTDASSLEVSGYVPTGAELVSAGTGWRQRPCGRDAGRYRCGLPTLRPGQSSFAVVTIRPATPGTRSHHLTAGPDALDRTTLAQHLAIDVHPPDDAPPVDLRLSDPDPHAATRPVGDAATDVVLVHNAGTRRATDVVVTVSGDAVPDDVEVVSATFGWFERPCEVATVVTCRLPAIAADGTSFVVLTTRPRAPGTIELAATVDAAQPTADPDSSRLVLRREAAAAP